MAIVAREEGFGALYKGLTPKVMRLGPGGAIMLVVYDYVYEFLDGYFKWNRESANSTKSEIEYLKRWPVKRCFIEFQYFSTREKQQHILQSICLYLKQF